MITFSVAITWCFAHDRKRNGRPSREAWRRLPASGSVWMGLILLTAAVSPVAAGALMVLVIATGAAFMVVLVARGVRDRRQIWQSLRSIGDPDAWRGTRSR